jgi:hypothetical protein
LPFRFQNQRQEPFRHFSRAAREQPRCVNGDRFSSACREGWATQIVFRAMPTERDPSVRICNQASEIHIY